jgi:DNA-binding transcriptional regulator PaaX
LQENAIMKERDTRSLLFGLFVQAGRRLTAAQVIALARPLGLSATNVKSHLTRLVKEGALERNGSVRSAEYAPTPSQQEVVEGIAARIRVAEPEPWDGAWLMLAPRMPVGRGEREWLRASLGFDGFRCTPARCMLAPGAYLRPAWPRAWALERARRYPGVCVFGGLLEPLGFMLLDEMYELDELDRQARKLATWIEARRIPGKAERAFAERMDVGGRVARLVSHDPRLPPVLWGRRTGLAALTEAYARYEKRVTATAEKFMREVTGG